MNIQSFHEKESGTWTHLLSDPVSNSAAIIDPVWVYDLVSGRASMNFMDEILDQADTQGLNILWILETHAHADHLTAADQLKKRLGARIACSQGIRQVQQAFRRVFNHQAMPADGSQFDRLLSEGDELNLGELTVRVIETPGHTNDSITYLVNDAAFIGDTLFAPSFGSARCDFPGGDASQLYDSIQKIYALPDETRLFLCHDYPKEGEQPKPWVRLAEMKQNNIHVKSDTQRKDFVEMRTQRDEQLNLPKLILPALQVNILAGALPEPQSNGVSYLNVPFNQELGDLIKEP